MTTVGGASWSGRLVCLGSNVARGLSPARHLQHLQQHNPADPRGCKLSFFLPDTFSHFNSTSPEGPAIAARPRSAAADVIAASVCSRTRPHSRFKATLNAHRNSTHHQPAARLASPTHPRQCRRLSSASGLSEGLTTRRILVMASDGRRLTGRRTST